MLDPRAVAVALGGTAHGDRISAPGPGHSPSDQSLSVTIDPNAPEGFWAHSFAGDRWEECRDHVRAAIGLAAWMPFCGPRRILAPALRRSTVDQSEAESRALARSLWHRQRSITGTVAERYLREARSITCALPTTLGFLPANGRHPAAMIAAFGLAHEVEPGVLAIDEQAVMAVHLTKLTPEGRKHPDEPNKITIGQGALGWPIVLAPMSDLLGLAITEGIEDALSIHEATGLGAWAAGGAPRMPALAAAIPDYVEALTIFADDDKAGRDNTRALAAALRDRHIEIVVEGL